MKDYLYIFVHIPKTAGSTFRYHISKNAKKGEELVPHPIHWGFPIETDDQKSLLKHIKKHVSKMTKQDRSRVKYIHSHFVPYGIHKFFDKEPRYYTFIRDPVSRMASYYNYFLTLHNREPEFGKNKDFYKRKLLVKGKVPEFEKWYEEKIENKDRHGLDILPTQDFLSRLGYLKSGKITNTKIKDMLNKFWFTGTLDSFANDANYLYGKFGFNKFYVSKNRSKYFVDVTKQDRLLKLLSNKLQDNKVIYNLAKEKHKRFASEVEEYDEIVSRLTMKRRILLPFTQLLDVRTNIGKVSGFFRKAIPLYGNLLDHIKYSYE